MFSSTNPLYRLVTVKPEGGLRTEETHDLAHHDICGINNNKHQRIELQGAPRLTHFVGPMWDGDAIRYESKQAYDKLSK